MAKRIPYSEIIRDTDKAWLIQLNTNDKPCIWLPKSKCTLIKTKMSIDVPDWMMPNIIQANILKTDKIKPIHTK